jgi:hypothetical protein
MRLLFIFFGRQDEMIGDHRELVEDEVMRGQLSNEQVLRWVFEGIKWLCIWITGFIRFWLIG